MSSFQPFVRRGAMELRKGSRKGSRRTHSRFRIAQSAQYFHLCQVVLLRGFCDGASTAGLPLTVLLVIAVVGRGRLGAEPGPSDPAPGRRSDTVFR